MELDPILAMEENLPSVMTQAAPQSQADKQPQQQQQVSSISVTDRSEDPVTSLLGGSGGGGGETSMKSPNAQITTAAAVYTSINPN